MPDTWRSGYGSSVTAAPRPEFDAELKAGLAVVGGMFPPTITPALLDFMRTSYASAPIDDLLAQLGRRLDVPEREVGAHSGRDHTAILETKRAGRMAGGAGQRLGRRGAVRNTIIAEMIGKRLADQIRSIWIIFDKQDFRTRQGYHPDFRSTRIRAGLTPHGDRPCNSSNIVAWTTRYRHCEHGS